MIQQLDSSSFILSMKLIPILFNDTIQNVASITMSVIRVHEISFEFDNYTYYLKNIRNRRDTVSLNAGHNV